jgi:Ulp1 family protease
MFLPQHSIHVRTCRVLTQVFCAQGDGGSCGVFMCAYADLLTRGARAPFAFSQGNIPAMRRAMAADILAGQIKTA